MEIAPGIYEMGGGYFKAGHTKAFLADTGDGLILIDTLYDHDANVILAELEKIGKTAADIKHIIMTHAHRGHLGGLKTLKQLSNAPIYGHPYEADMIAGDRNIQPVDPLVVDPIQSWPIIFLGQLMSRFNKHHGQAVDILIEDGHQIGPLEAIHTPGHTPGHMVLYWPERRALFTGDAFVTWPRICPGWPNTMLNKPQTWASLQRMASIDAEIICPGHGDSIKAGGSAIMREMAADKELESYYLS